MSNYCAIFYVVHLNYKVLLRQILQKDYGVLLCISQKNVPDFKLGNYLSLLHKIMRQLVLHNRILDYGIMLLYLTRLCVHGSELFILFFLSLWPSSYLFFIYWIVFDFIVILLKYAVSLFHHEFQDVW